MRAAVASALFGVLFVGCGDSHSECGGPVISGCTLLIGAPDGGYNACYDVGTEAVCVAGEWKCPEGSVPEEECDCEGNAAGSPRSCGNQPDAGSSGG